MKACPNAKPNQSLAEWVAECGGVALGQAPGRSGEVRRLRETNKRLRGRRRVVAISGGIAYDRLAMYAREEGFPVEEDTFLDVLEEDAWALAIGDTRKRCYASYDLTSVDTDFAFELEARQHDHDHTPCSVCGRSCEDGICEDCLEWFTRTTRELIREKERTRSVLSFFETMRGAR